MEQKKVAIYTTPTCTYCKATKEFFHEKNIVFDEYDVAKDAVRRNEMIQKSGQLGVPVIAIGDDLVIGYNRPKLEELLGVQ